MKFLFFGIGSIAKRHIENIAKLEPSAEFFAYRERSLSLGEFGKKYRIEIFNKLDDVFSQKYDAAFITNPSSLHMPFVLLAAENNCNLFIEKPVSNNLDDIDKLTEIVRSKNLITFVAYNMRFHPAIKKIKETLNKLGKLYFARLQVGEYLPDWHPNEHYSEGYSARKELGGGAILTMIHEIDYLLWLKHNPNRVYSMMTKVSNLKIDVEDNVELILGYEDGFIAEINLNYLMRKHSRICQIVGENGMLEWDYYKNSLNFHNNKEEKIIWQNKSFKRNDMFLEEMKHFLACIKENKKTDIDLNEGLKSLRIVMAAKESNQYDKVITCKM